MEEACVQTPSLQHQHHPLPPAPRGSWLHAGPGRVISLPQDTSLVEDPQEPTKSAGNFFLHKVCHAPPPPSDMTRANVH